MTNLSLSDANYVSDFDLILDSIFNEPNPAKQPKYLVEIGVRNGFTLRHAYNHIKTATKRGKDLDNPLEVIALLHKDSQVDHVQKELLGIPHHIVAFSDGTAAGILKDLKSLNIEARLCLYLKLFPDKIVSFNNYTELQTQFGVIALQSHEIDSAVIKQTADNYFLEAAQSGWFSKLMYQYPSSSPLTQTTLSHFKPRPYLIRTATSKDLPVIFNLEKSNLSEIYRLPTQLIQKCIDQYPEGQLIMETEKEILGFILSQKIANLDDLNTAQESTLETLEDPKGSIILLMSLLVVSKKHELKDQFLEFFLQKALVTNNIRQVASVLRCHNFPGQDVIGMESYVEELILEKGRADIATNLHVIHGAEINYPIPGYRPKDERNLGYGVLVSYTRNSRLLTTSQQPVKELPSFEEEINSEFIHRTIDQMTHIFLQNCSAAKGQYDRTATFADMGIESLQLLQLRAMLSSEFAIDLPKNFFIICQTPNSIINFFIESKLQLYKQWLYETKWRSTAIPKPEILTPGKVWIIFEDLKNDIGLSLKEMLHDHNQKCISVALGNVFLKEDEENYTINSFSEEDYKRLLDTIPNRHNLCGIIYLWNDTENLNEFSDPTIEILEATHRNNLEGLVFLLNTLASIREVNTPRLWVVTQSIDQDGKVTSLAEWPLSALCKVAREEYQKFNCTLVAIDPQEKPTESCERLFDEIRSKTNEPQIAFRKGERLVPRLIPSEIEEIRVPKFSSQAFYLIAGGLRPLGILIARWYVSHGAKHLILLDEVDSPPEIAAVIEELREEGVEIDIEKLNFTDEAGFKKTFERISHYFKPLKGVVHAVGFVDNDLIMSTNWSQFMSQHRLKVTLSWHLHCHTQKFDLDHFIMFSSCLPDIAPLGKAIHATGNSFLDALTYYRRKRALPSLTIDWGPWELRHMEIQRPFETNISDRVQMMKIKDGLQALDHLFYIPKPQIMVAVVNWPILIRGVGDASPLFNEIATEMGFKRVDILRQYMEATPDNRLNLIQTYLHESVRKILKHRSNFTLESGRELPDIGMDTTKMSTLRNHIQFDLLEAIQLPFNFVETNSSIEKLSQALTLALDDVIKSKPKFIFDESIAVIGLKNNKISLDVIQENGMNIEIKELSDEVLEDLKMKLQKPERKKVPTIIIMENNE